MSSSSALPLRRPPPVPRDLPWAVSFLFFVPLSLVVPILTQRHDQPGPLLLPPLSVATVHALWWAAVATFFLSRYLYQWPQAGPPGDNARHAIVHALGAAAAVAVAVYLGLAVAICVWLPHVYYMALIPLWYTVRDAFLVRRWKRRGYHHTAGVTLPSQRESAAAAAVSDTTASRQAFFQALAGTALDILSRSLRRASLVRVLSLVLIVQTALLFVWRWALLGALGSRHYRGVLLVGAIIGGKWATGTVARLLSLVASGGVAQWFVEQSAALQQHQQQQQQHSNNTSTTQQATTTSTTATTSSLRNVNDDDDDDDDDRITALHSNRMPAAYRTVDASIYQSVLDVDAGLLDDDDDDLDDEDFWETTTTTAPTVAPRPRTLPPSRLERLQQQQHVTSSMDSDHKTKSTVKSLLRAGLSISFGSVVQCGLLGGLAQFVWSQLRKAEAAESVWIRLREALARQAALRGNRRRHNLTTSTTTGFTNMPVGNTANNSSTSAACGSNEQNVLQKVWIRVASLARTFVRNHSDLAMSHVAAYYKNYHRAAHDVSALIQQSGVEPIIHDDITTHVCACVGGSISGLVVLLAGYVLQEDRQAMGNNNQVVSDFEFFQDMLVAFILCYTLLFTVMEPLRASIKAVYVSFAEHPASLSQAYPLIFHRLRRLSESNLS